MLRKILHISYWVLGLVAVFSILAFSKKRQQKVLCHTVEIEVQSDSTSMKQFIDEEDLRKLLENTGNSYTGTPVSEINTGLLETVLLENPFVEKAEVFSSIDGNLTIKVSERKAILRVEGSTGEAYYMDKTGKFMPLSEKYTPRVLIASGYIYEPFSYGAARMLFSERELKDTLKRSMDLPYYYSFKDTLYTLAAYIDKNLSLKTLSGQIYVNATHQIELIPTVGEFTILFGNIADMEKKFAKLLMFYKEGLSKIGFSKYKTVDLRYENQVVCTKKLAP